MRYGPKWDSRFMAVAREVATWSKDPNKQVGAVLVSPDGRRISWGYNGLPAGLSDDECLDNGKGRLSLSLHAELNALANCSERPVNWCLFVTEFPCAPCAAILMQSGVTRVVAPSVLDRSSWTESQRLARIALQAAGIIVKEYKT